jgi:hypothetical protein
MIWIDFYFIFTVFLKFSIFLINNLNFHIILINEINQLIHKVKLIYFIKLEKIEFNLIG